MPRFLHTSDWQLGLKLRFIPGENGAQARLARFDTVRRIADLARQHAADAVVVAGDVFDDNAVGADTLQRARDALASFAPVPVLLLPGNHDPGEPGGALERLDLAEHGLDHVELLLDDAPRHISGLTFYPCPLTRRHTFDDPTSRLPPRDEEEGGETVRVAVAHGGILDFGESTESPNLIDAGAVLAKGFDYLALGDWHGTFHLGPRVWYSGTPEPTRFEEKDPGNVLLVEIEAPGAEPRVKKIPVAWARWQREAVALGGDEDLEGLEARIRALPEKSRTLLSLELEGSLSLAQRGRLEEILDTAGGQLLLLRWNREGLSLRPEEEDFDSLELDGFVGRAVEELRGELPGETGAEAQEALFLLHRLLQEEAP